MDTHATQRKEIRSKKLDGRYPQIIFLFFLYGTYLYLSKNEASPYTLGGCLFISLWSQAILDGFYKRKFNFLSPAISAISLNILIQTSHPIFLMGLCAVAVFSKGLIRFQGKHFFNPTNFAIVLALIFFDQLFWASPSIWPQSYTLGIIFLAVGIYINKKVHVLNTSLFFIGTYLSLHLIRHLWLGDPLSIFVLKLKFLPFWIFSLFMITDPRTNPNHPMGKILFAILVAYSSYLLETKYYIRHAYFYALFFYSLFIPLLDMKFKNERFKWIAYS